MLVMKKKKSWLDFFLSASSRDQRFIVPELSVRQGRLCFGVSEGEAGCFAVISRELLSLCLCGGLCQVIR